MPQTAMPTESVEIGCGECLALLSHASVGRVVFTQAAMPAAQPVAFLLDRDEIVFRAEGALGDAGIPAVVAFEADEIDRLTFTGWSVHGIGEAYLITESARLVTLAPRALLGAAAIAPLIAIRLRHLTGHRVRDTAPPDSGVA